MFSVRPHMLEAIAGLDLVKPSALDVMCTLFDDIERVGPRGLDLILRKREPQLTADQKNGLQVRANAYLSCFVVEHLLTEKGLLRPLTSLEPTFLRAYFNFRCSTVASQHHDLGVPYYFQLDGIGRACAGCVAIEGERANDANELLKKFPIVGCQREACAVVISVRHDFLAKLAPKP